VVVVESASGDLVVKEDVMLAIPIMVAFALLLGWVLIKLTLNALPLFAGFAVTMLAQDLGSGILASLAAGALAALSLVALGRSAAGLSSPSLRLVLGIAFAVPAGAAAYHAARGLTGLVAGGSAGAMASMIVALLIGVTAWRRTAMGSDHP
jgi:hypothetical protein